MNQKIPEKSYQQARQEAQRRFEENLSFEVQQRIDLLIGSTIESLTANIEDLHLRRHSTDTLKFLKVAASLRLLFQLGILEQEEHEELDKYISHLHERVPLDMGE